MGELANCSRCNNVFVKTLRDICQQCYREEEEAFETVYRFLSQRKNREATLMEIVEATGVEEELVIKFIKEKRLRTSQFPKLAYPCEKCGTHIVSGKLCTNCSETLLQDLERHEQIEARQLELDRKEKEKINIYYTLDKHKK
ncbi:MAG TPA: TIGR03826 family flagellar region protein [Virgibacillus sp.]|nr:TIGR03826 family flagellar region protein [Virgibacillus sp.]